MTKRDNDNTLDTPISQKETWEIIKPVCRELYDLVNAGNIQFVSGIYNERNGMYKINLRCSRIHQEVLKIALGI
jgi:hypothetical protein